VKRSVLTDAYEGEAQGWGIAFISRRSVWLGRLDEYGNMVARTPTCGPSMSTSVWPGEQALARTCHLAKAGISIP
jgi:hypothetical protein